MMGRFRAILWVLLCAGLLYGQAENADNGGKAAEDLKVKVLEVQGKVLYRTDPDAEWAALEKGDTIPVGATVRTMLRAKARFQMGPDTTVELDQLGTMSLLKFAKEENVLHSHIMKKYGRIEFDVAKDGAFKNDFQIASPGSVLAVRGTEGVHAQWDRLRVEGQEGVFTLERPYGRVYLVGPKDLVNEQMLDWVSQFIDNLISRATDPNMDWGAVPAPGPRRYFQSAEDLASLRDSVDSMRDSEQDIIELHEGGQQQGPSFGGDF